MHWLRCKSFMVCFWLQLIFCVSLRPRGPRWSPLLLRDLHKLVFQLVLFLLRLVIILRRYLYLRVVMEIPLWRSVLLLMSWIILIGREPECAHIWLRLCHLWGVYKRVLNGYVRVVDVKIRRVLISGYVRNIANVHPWRRVVLRLLTHLLRFWFKLRLCHTQRNPSTEHIILLFCYLFL